jgi:hypothetical protein
MKCFRISIAVLAVTVIATHAAFAGFGTPEIDPGTGMAALALLSGAILVIRGRA